MNNYESDQNIYYLNIKRIIYNENLLSKSSWRFMSPEKQKLFIGISFNVKDLTTRLFKTNRTRFYTLRLKSIILFIKWQQVDFFNWRRL